MKSSILAHCATMAFLLAISAGSIAKGAETEESWSGVWNNRKYRSTGPLKCTVTAKEGNKWQATFEGKGVGKPFRYDVSFQAAKRGTLMLLKGTSTIRGHQYRWEGYIRGRALYGRYQGSNGDNGAFQLLKPQ